MALLNILKKGSTSRSVELYVFDNTTGLPKTGLTYASTGIDLWYRRERSAVVSITEVTLAALTTAYASGSFIEVGMGWYSLDVPDAALATGANFVLIGGTFTGYTVVGGMIKLVDYDPENANSLGLAVLPATAVPGAANGLIIAGTNAPVTITGSGNALTLTSTGGNGDGLQVNGNGSGDGGRFTGGATGHGLHGIGGNTSGSGSGIVGTGGATTGNGIRAVGTTQSEGIVGIGAGTTSGIHGNGGTSGAGIKATGGSTSGIGISVTTTLGNGVQIAPTVGHGIITTGEGTSKHGIVATGSATTGVGAAFIGGSTSGAGITVTTTSGDGVSITPTAGHGIVATGNGTSKHGIIATGGTAGTSDGLKALAGTGGVDIRGELGSVMTESYSTRGAGVTLPQGIYELLANKDEVAVSGVTLTTNKRDHSTPAMTHTLNSGTAPTSRTRAT